MSLFPQRASSDESASPVATASDATASDATASGTTGSLKRLMQAAAIVSYRALAEQAGVSRWQVQQLRQGKIDQMRLATLRQIATALNVSLTQLLESFIVPSPSGASPSGTCSPPIEQTDPVILHNRKENYEFKREYDRLQARLESIAEETRQAVHRESLEQLESWLLQWPTIVHKAQENEGLAAAKVVKFVDPVLRLIEGWGVSAIAPVDSTMPYDPQQHQLMDGTATPGDPVRVRYAGYTYQGKLLHRARVSPAC